MVLGSHYLVYSSSEEQCVMILVSSVLEALAFNFSTIEKNIVRLKDVFLISSWTST